MNQTIVISIYVTVDAWLKFSKAGSHFYILPLILCFWLLLYWLPDIVVNNELNSSKKHAFKSLLLQYVFFSTLSIGQSIRRLLNIRFWHEETQLKEEKRKAVCCTKKPGIDTESERNGFSFLDTRIWIHLFSPSVETKDLNQCWVMIDSELSWTVPDDWWFVRVSFVCLLSLHIHLNNWKI